MHGPEGQLIFALALGAGVTAQVVARHLRLPSIVLLLGVGVVLGPDGAGLIRPDRLGEGLFGLVQIAVAVILFEGGLSLDLRRLRHQSSAIRMLVTAGAIVTAVGGSLAARWVMEWPWTLSVIFGTLVIVTGPTVIRPILRNVPLRRRLATVLEAEGVLIDPIGAIVAAITLQIVLAPTTEVASGLWALGVRLGFGAFAGAGFGFLLGRLLSLDRVVPEGLENLVTLGAVLVLSEVCNAVLSESGILAVTVAGVVVGNLDTRVSRELREFQDLLTVGLLGILFVLLAADVRVSEVLGLGWRGVLTVAALAFLVRPANVVVSTVRSDLDLRDKAFLSWIAPRGIVAAAVASLFAAVLDAEGMAGGSELRALVFLTIALTVVVQAGSAPLAAWLLGVRAPGRDMVAILGAEEFGLTLGEILRQGNTRVLFLDANPGHCRAAEERDFPVVYGNALEERTLARARLEQARVAIGLTANDEVNGLFAQEAREEFGVRACYAALNRADAGITPAMLAKRGVRVLFDGPKEVERWNVRVRHGQARVDHYRFAGRGEPTGEGAGQVEARGIGGEGPDAYAVLAVQRGSEWLPMHTDFEPRADDVAAIAVYVSEEEAARQELERLGWVPLEAETEQASEA